MTGTTVRANGVDLCVETFGERETPVILLVSGATASMDWWDAGFCRLLADGGRFVIRYDHRDTGRSVNCPPGAPNYTGRDLVEDAVGLIDVLAGGRAHVVGLSMGGAIAQDLAAGHPDRVVTLTLMSTSPISRRHADDELPPMAERARKAFADPPPEPDWADHDAVVEYLVEGERPFAGQDSFDEAYTREVARRVVDRTIDLEAAAKNHWLVGDEPGEEGEEGTAPDLGDVTAPTLVVHGTDDPLFPPGHATALVREIAGAELLLLEGVGHEVPPPRTWDLVVPAILRHTEG